MTSERVIKSGTSIIAQIFVPLSGTRVKYLDHEKRANIHEIWSDPISEKVSYNRLFWYVQRD